MRSRVTREERPETLRDLLFEQIERVRDGDQKDLERASAIAELADKVVAAARTQIRAAEVYDKLQSEEARMILAGGRVAGLLPGDTSLLKNGSGSG